MTKIQEWKENVLQIEGILLNAIHLINEKLLDIEEKAIKNFSLTHIEDYKEVLDIFTEYFKTHNVPGDEIWDTGYA